MRDIFTQIAYVIGRLGPNGVQMLGTGFLVREDGHIVTTHHVTSSNEQGLVILAPKFSSFNAYQDMADTSCGSIAVQITAVDPIRDLAILKADMKFTGKGPILGSFDDDPVGAQIEIYGFPHCVEGRRVLTFQRAEIGAKVLLANSDIKSKQAIINTQARPGQSGSAIFSPHNGRISGVLVGAWKPPSQGISLGGIDPRELHQTTHCVSAEYVKDML